MRQNEIHGFTSTDQDWIGLMIFKNFADRDWIGFNFCISGLDSDWKISQSAHLCNLVSAEIPRCDHFLFFTLISFVVNHTINATPPERLQQYDLAGLGDNHLATLRETA